MASADLDLDTIDAEARLDGFLRFRPSVAERYEREHGAERVRDLSRIGLLGIALYNVYNFTSIVLLPDIVWLTVALRVLLFTPGALVLVWLVGRVDAVRREQLMLAGMIGGILPPIFMFWLTRAPLGAYTFGEFAVTIVFGNMLLALRFPHAVIATATALTCTTLAALTKAGLDEGLRIAFVVQFATACTFSLYANYRMEARRCRDYLVSLRARLVSDAAERERSRFEDLCRTDALTGLPNRRAFDECIARWCAAGDPMAVMMIDVDHFKELNDTLGHLAGDDCLRRVAEPFAALASGRLTLFCARYGGEEFALVSRGADAPEATRLADSLVRAVEVLGLAHPGRPDGQRVVTVSIGLALRPAGAQTGPAGLLAAADRALYEAKRRGRNRHVLDGARLPGLALPR